MPDTKRDLIIFQKKGEEKKTRNIKIKIIIIVVSSKTTKTTITKTTSCTEL